VQTSQKFLKNLAATLALQEFPSIFAIPNSGILTFWPIRLVVRTQGFHP
jgi:hypothetical protein